MKQAVKVKPNNLKERFLLECKRLERAEKVYWRTAAGFMAELSLSVVVGVGITVFLIGLCLFIKMQ